MLAGCLWICALINLCVIVFECEFECFIILMCLQLHFYSKRRDIISNQTSKTSAVSTEHQKKETFFSIYSFVFFISRAMTSENKAFSPYEKKSLEINWMIVCNQRMNRQHACPNVLCKCNDFPFASSFQWVFYECQPCVRFVGSTQSNIPFDSSYR